MEERQQLASKRVTMLAHINSVSLDRDNVDTRVVVLQSEPPHTRHEVRNKILEVLEVVG